MHPAASEGMKTAPHRFLVSPFLIGGFLVTACRTEIPARVDTVNGRQVEIAMAGSGGSATVVFEAGLGEDWTGSCERCWLPWCSVFALFWPHVQSTQPCVAQVAHERATCFRSASRARKMRTPALLLEMPTSSA